MSDEVEPERWSRWHEVAVVAGVEVAAEVAVPGSGGPVGLVVSELFERRRQRVEELAGQVFAEVAPDDLIDQLRADPRFGELFVLALERVRTAGWEQKRVAMGRVVLGALAGDDAELDQSERLLAALHELEALDFDALARLHAVTRALGPDKSIILKEVPGLEDSVGALYRHGAVAQESGYGALAYRSTSMGERLLALVLVSGTGGSDATSNDPTT